MYKNIVVGYDGSDRAMRAVEQAADLATALGSQLHLVTAVSKDRIHEFGESSDKRKMSDVDIAGERLTSVASNFNHLDIRSTARQGAPADVLLEEAVEVDADLILVGNRRVQGIGRVLGSIAEDVAHKAPCDVVIAKTS